MSEKAASLAGLLSVPEAGGSLKGLGEKFSADLHTGTGNFSVPISVPAGRNGFQPSLALSYSSGSGNGPFGLGWSLSVPAITRLTSKGIPRYWDDVEKPSDVFVLSGAEDLVEVAREASGATYRPRTEGLFAQITRKTGENEWWEVRTKDGLLSIYGSDGVSAGPPWQADKRAVIAAPDNRRKVFAWHLSETRDLFGNRIVYEYERDADGTAAGWEQNYLRHIRYVDLDDGGGERFLISIELVYDAGPPNIEAEYPTRSREDAFSEFRAGFEIRTRRRCKAIVVRSHPDAGQDVLIRAYELIYLDEKVSDLSELPLNRASLLARINVVGYDDDGRGHREMPPLDFDYTRFDPSKKHFSALGGRSLPLTSLADPNIELVDLFGSGLPDIVELGDSVRYWRNLGGGKFDSPRPYAEAPSEWRLANAGVQLMDADGDGRADLVVTTGGQSGYYPMDFRAGFDRGSFQPFQAAPSFNLEDPEVRLLDLTGDGVTDVLRTGSSFECFFNDAELGWTSDRTTLVPRQRSESFPNVNFSDPRVKLSDLSGDGLQDILLVHEGRIDWWPNLGWGRWGARRAMAIPGGLPFDFDPQRVLLGDVDGDGLADLIYVSDREILLWVNRAGNRWSDPVRIRGTPAVNSLVNVRLTDLYGLGTSGLLWTRDATVSDGALHFFLDFTGGRKANLLVAIDNNMGASTEVTYVSSVQHYLRDERLASTRWQATLPFPVQVVERVTVRDMLSQGKLTTEYRYHHGCWDGQEREFRGFGMVEQIDTEVFDGYAGRGLNFSVQVLNELFARESFSPPLLNRTWFHVGPVRPAEGGPWRELDYSKEYWPGDTGLLDHSSVIELQLSQLSQLSDEGRNDARRDALRTLRGNVLRSELYALDGSVRHELPYTVTETAYALREEGGPATAARRHIFFSHIAAQRTTQWERGDDPLTQFSFVEERDEWGQPKRHINIACPRGWRTRADRPAAPYLSTMSNTRFAAPVAAGAWPRNRVAQAISYELQYTAGKTLDEVLAASRQGQSLRPIAVTANYFDGNSGQAFVGLGLGEIGDHGALVRSESLVLTTDIVTAAYAEAYRGETPAILADGLPFGSEYPPDFIAGAPRRAGYRFEDGMAVDLPSGWYARTLSRQYDFHNPAASRHRGLLLAEQDALGNVTTVEAYWKELLPSGVRGPADIFTEATYSSRLLLARVTDPNRNVIELRYSPTGLVTETFYRGKLGAAPSDTANAGDRENASVSVAYGLRAFCESVEGDQRNAQPCFVRTVRLVYHDGDPDAQGAPYQTIETREYSDGFGRVLQTRTQDQALRFGDERFGNEVVPQSQGSDPGNDPASRAPVVGRLNARNQEDDHVNVTVSGWRRYDNKGRIVEKFEPFFAQGWGWSELPASSRGARVRMAYDARGNLLRTMNPDGSEVLVVRGTPLNLGRPPRGAEDLDQFNPSPWLAYTYDGNDNAGRTHSGQFPHTSYPHHYDTPASVEIDALGRAVRSVVRYRGPANPAGQLPPLEEHCSNRLFDIHGNVVLAADALGRTSCQYVYDLAKRRLYSRSLDSGSTWTVFDSVGNPVEHKDAKGSLGLHAYDMLNRPTRLWARDTASDPVILREVLRYGEQQDFAATAFAANQIGRLVQHFDEAGIATALRYDFKGNLLESSRQIISDEFLLATYRTELAKPEAERTWVLPVPRIDWSASQIATILGPVYTTQSAFDALNRVKWFDYPEAANRERYRVYHQYNRAGALNRVYLLGPMSTGGIAPREAYVQDIAYNARGQRTLIAFGNGIVSRYAYDSRTFRLTRLRTELFSLDGADPVTYTFSGAPLQDMVYTHDLVGNILGIQEVTVGCGVEGNPDSVFYDGNLALRLIAGDALIRRFEYDPLYRLVAATGRESTNILDSGRPWTDDARNGYNSGALGPPNQSNAPKLTRLYREELAYDAASNTLTTRHQRRLIGSGGVWQVAWSRRFGFGGYSHAAWLAELEGRLNGDWTNPPSNRLTHAEDRSAGVLTPDAGQSHWYDDNGNLIRELNERRFQWDYSNRLKAFRNQIDDSRPTTYALYVYDSSGMRVKKLVVNGGNGYSATTYIGGGFEHHCEKALNGGTISENCSLQVLDGQKRIAVLRAGPAFEDDGAKEHRVKYYFADHIGSCTLVVSGDQVWSAQAWISREEFFPNGETSFGGFGRKRYRFTGMERDNESRLCMHSNRYYAPWLSRWVSADPVGPVDDLNLYTYAKNSPLKFTDNSGLAPGEGGEPGTKITFVVDGVEQTSDYGLNPADNTVPADAKPDDPAAIGTWNFLTSQFVWLGATVLAPLFLKNEEDLARVQAFENSLRIRANSPESQRDADGFELLLNITATVASVADLAVSGATALRRSLPALAASGAVSLSAAELKVLADAMKVQIATVYLQGRGVAPTADAISSLWRLTVGVGQGTRDGKVVTFLMINQGDFYLAAESVAKANSLTLIDPTAEIAFGPRLGTRLGWSHAEQNFYTAATNSGLVDPRVATSIDACWDCQWGAIESNVLHVNPKSIDRMPW